ncbi:zinc finger protein 408 [Phycodurus eques]|uniref:zinc finger protein 408 n=1 Tax=Phycodurus eques TaxID=693459 RepID=UPI002ACE923F|nr:zinc finger protein 408 [Phycodurus eques]
MMASCLAPAVPTAVATFLSTLLPCGFAVGPSMSCKGRLGLWWVGRALQVGYLLGKEGDTEWVQKFETGPLPPQDLIMTPESITDSTREEKARMQIAENNDVPRHKAVWINFACQVQSKALHNVAVQCTCAEMCVGKCVSICLRVCHEIQPGTELLLGGEIERRSDARDRLDVQDISEGQQREYPVKLLRGPEKDVTNPQIIQERQDDQTDEEEGRDKEPYELSKIHSATLSLNRGSAVVNTAAKVVSTVMISNDHTDSTDSVMAAVHTRLKLNSTERQRTLGGPAPSVRCSSRLAAKPRQVHCLSSRIKEPPVHPLPNRHIDRQESLTEVAKSSAETVLSMGTSDSDTVAVRAANLTVDAPTCCPKVRERRYRCSSCGKKFYEISHLKKHQLSHTEAKSFTSQDCGKNHTSADNLKAHQLRHRGERPFSCPHCEKTYGLPRNLKEHLFLHTGEKPYVCEHCGKTFARRSSLRDHRLLYCSGLIYTQPPKLQCTLCPKLLANSGSLSNHMKLHTGEKPHICQHCGKSFSQKGNLNSHLRIHNGERPFPCPECDQRFAQKAELCRHRLSHTGASFLCSYCGKSLRDPHTLKSHERLHTGDRPHRCTICGKGYTMATKLRRHIKSSHVTEKPYRCHCGASYTLRQSLLRHQVQHQSQEETEEELKEALRQKAKPAMQEYAAVNSHHPKPVKGRPKKGAEDGRVQRRRRGKGEEKGSGKLVRRSETAIAAGGDRKASSDTQHAVVFVHTDNTATPRYGPLLLTSLNLHSGTGQELFEVVISEGAEQCFVVQGQQTVGDLMIVQEEELCSVAQTVEINTL